MPELETSHFWVGRFSEEIAANYFVEDRSEDEEGPISLFARDQGETYYDHDFLEYGWGQAATIPELVAGHSYSEEWADELARRVAAAGLTDVNFFIFISEDKIEQPRSIDGDGYWLRYLGTITYKI